MRTYITNIKGERIPMQKILISIWSTGMLYAYVENIPRDMEAIKPNRFVDETGIPQDGIMFSKVWIARMNIVLGEHGSIHVANFRDKYPTNEQLFMEFDNVPLKNPYMDIKWPVYKENNRLKVTATGSGWWLYYKTDNGDYVKAKHPDGTEWHLRSRIEGLEIIYRLNGWKVPKGGFK